MKHLTRASLLFALGLFAALPACKSDKAHEHEKESEEIPVKQQPATTLVAAIATAQKSQPGGRFLAAEIENEGGKVICSVVFAIADGAHEVNIDGASGAILNTENEKIGPKTQALLAELAKNPGAAPVTPAQAIEAALKKLPGSWALAADFGRDEDALVYSVVLAGGKEPMVAHVSAADGTVKKVTEMEEEDEQDEAGEKH